MNGLLTAGSVAPANHFLSAHPASEIDTFILSQCLSYCFTGQHILEGHGM